METFKTFIALTEENRELVGSMEELGFQDKTYSMETIKNSFFKSISSEYFLDGTYSEIDIENVEWEGDVRSNFGFLIVTPEPTSELTLTEIKIDEISKAIIKNLMHERVKEGEGVDYYTEKEIENALNNMSWYYLIKDYLEEAEDKINSALEFRTSIDGYEIMIKPYINIKKIGPDLDKENIFKYFKGCLEILKA